MKLKEDDLKDDEKSYLYHKLFLYNLVKSWDPEALQLVRSSSPCPCHSAPGAHMGPSLISGCGDHGPDKGLSRLHGQEPRRP